MKFITALHGNEVAPIVALASLQQPFIIGNPRAVLSRKRFLEKDLNQSFLSLGNTYEEQRAREMLLQIPENEEVIDLHTFSCSSEAFVILTDLSMLPLAQKTGLKKVVYMKHNIKQGHALLNARSGISIEVGEHEDEASIIRTKNIIHNLLSDRSYQIDLYEVYDTIQEPGEYKNFTLHNAGFYPVLAGEKAYQFYGLKARLCDSA